MGAANFTLKISCMGQNNCVGARKHLHILPSNTATVTNLLTALRQLLRNSLVNDAHHDSKLHRPTTTKAPGFTLLLPPAVHEKSLLRIVSTMCMGTVKTPRV
jgi:hypothetical protein